MTDTSEQVRREFEAWMNAKHPELARLATMRQGDGYDGRWMSAAWEGYKAGRESAGGIVTADELVDKCCQELCYWCHIGNVPTLDKFPRGGSEWQHHMQGFAAQQCSANRLRHYIKGHYAIAAPPAASQPPTRICKYCGVDMSNFPPEQNVYSHMTGDCARVTCRNGHLAYDPCPICAQNARDLRTSAHAPAPEEIARWVEKFTYALPCGHPANCLTGPSDEPVCGWCAERASAQPPAPATLEAASKRMENAEQHENSAAPAPSGELLASPSGVALAHSSFQTSYFPTMGASSRETNAASEAGNAEAEKSVTSDTPPTLAPTPDDATLRYSDWPECKDFYDLMQSYRHCPLTNVEGVKERYENVKAYLRQKLREAIERDRAIRAGGKG